MNAIQGASPWTRTAVANLTPDEFAEIEATVPDGMYAVLLCGRRPGDWSVSLLRAVENGQRPQAVEVARVKCLDIVNGVRAAVAKAAA